MNGLHTTASDFSVRETIERMVAIIEVQGWHLFARIDHTEHARRKGLELRPTELILFGNPEIGARLMQDRQPAAIGAIVRASMAREDFSERSALDDIAEQAQTIVDEALAL